MDLKSFSQQNTGGSAKVGGMSETDVRRAIKYFSGMSNDQLMRELSKHLTAKKNAGKEAEILGVLERIKPMLSAEQRQRLEDILRKV